MLQVMSNIFLRTKWKLQKYELVISQVPTIGYATTQITCRNHTTYFILDLCMSSLRRGHTTYFIQQFSS